VALRAPRSAATDQPDALTTSPEHHATTDPLVAVAARLQAVCVARGWTLATAESCTGGLVGHAVTEVPGSSAYYLGGVIAYSNAQKQRLLGVADAALERHGAVSAQVALAMAIGARQSFGTTFAAAVTGIAGPDGGTPQKPVGLVYIAVADPTGHDVRRFVWGPDRHENKERSAEAALLFLLERAEALVATGSDGSGA
jgi:PncC family amidohydrolase